MAELSPMMKQYKQIKSEHEQCIVFFRLGDFYEMFFEDAILASRELELTLTGRDCGQEERAPMCGVPHHSCEAYIARLVAKGYKVAICEQTEDPAAAKGIVKREIVRVITPGTVTEHSMLDESANNFLAAVYLDGSRAGLCFTDFSTGEVFVTDIEGADAIQKIINELSRFNPKEVLLNRGAAESGFLTSFIKDKLGIQPEHYADSAFFIDSAKERVLSHFDIEELDVLKIEEKLFAACALGAALTYLYETQKTGLERIAKVEVYTDRQFMSLDMTARRNLEITETMRSGEKRGSLLWVLDKTKTAMGKRLIRSFLEQPLMSETAILKRQNAVGELLENTMLRNDISDMLTGIFDMERLMTRIVYGTGGGRELKALSAAVEKIPSVKFCLTPVTSQLLTELNCELDPLTDIHELIERSIVDEPPVTVREGNVIKSGYNEEIDSLRADMTDSKGFIARIEASEKEKTGIKTLKVGYNRVFGYYIEVSKGAVDQVPDEYIRKQTLSNCERYITGELKELESRVLGAQDRVCQLEYELFTGIRETVAAQLDRISRTAAAIAKLDVFVSFAESAMKNRYICPDIKNDGKIIIKDGRHPVVELLLKDSPFVPNDVNLNGTDERVAIITGPNMAGKSTYMRQVALIVLMAQIGSFVPASYASISITDSIFTRVGASDDLSTGQSTFMVEMNEVAGILKNATNKSLLILDEIGRGTSTYDGMSIARAVIEFVADKKKLGAKALFATHYHELTELEALLDGVKNYNVACKKRGDDITFLRRIVPGGADDSYGIEVAKLAGVPDSVIKRAKDVLSELEQAAPIRAKAEAREESPQISLTSMGNGEIIGRLKAVDANTLTPIEALQMIYELAKMARE